MGSDPILFVKNWIRPLFCAAVLTLFSLSTALAQSLAPEDEVRYGHVEYFGFYASAFGAWNFTAELAPHTNLTWIHIGSPANTESGLDAMLQRLQEAKDAGVSAVLSIESFLFANEEGDLRDAAEVEDFLVELRARLEEADLFGTVAMLYPKDEPFREFVEARDPSLWEEYVTGEVYDDVYEVLYATNERLRTVFPEIPIGVILSGYRLHHDFFSIPDNYDWIGFDCYKDMFNSCDDETFDRHYARLISNMTPDQRLMAVFETWVDNERTTQADWPEVLRKRLLHHYEMVLSDPRFVAIIPFIWSFESDNEVPGLGMDRFAELFDDGVDNIGTQFVNTVLDIGQQVKTRQFEYPNLHYSETEDSPYRPPSSIRGELVSLDDSGLVTAWAVNDALPYKNLRMQLQARDTRGRVVYKSRTERSFLPGPGWTRLGTPVYRHRIPADVLRRNPANRLVLELRVFADGEPREMALDLTLGPLKPEISDIGSR